MKPINFISSLNRHQQRALRRWYFFSLLLVASTVIGIVVLQSIQLHELYQTKIEHRTIKEQVDTLQLKREPYKQWQQQKQTLQKKKPK